MSAYFCSTATFHLIATYAATVDATADLKAVWRQLIAENLRSLNHRYPYDQPDNVKTAAAELAAITDRPMLPLPAPGVIRSALSEFDYQACEHDGYSSSPAGLLIARLLATIDEPAPDHPAGWFPIDELPQAQPEPQPAMVTAPAMPPFPSPAQTGSDPIDAARARLAAMFAMPAAPEPEPAPEPPSGLESLSIKDRQTGLILLLTLARVSDGSPDGKRFHELAEIVGHTLSTDQRAWASGKSAENAAALRAVLDAAG